MCFNFLQKGGCFLKKVIAVNIAVRAPGPGRRRRNKILDIRYVTGLAISYPFLVSLHWEYMRYIAYIIVFIVVQWYGTMVWYNGMV